MRKIVQIKNPLPNANALGQRFPRWHAKHPSNAVVVPAVVAPTIGKDQ